MKEFLKSLIRFTKSLISDANDVSHKRVIALLSFLVLVAMVPIKALGYDLDSNLIYVFASLSGGSSLLTVIEKFKKGT